MGRRWLDPQSAADLGKLDPEAIERVRSEAWPDAADEDELHDALLWLGFLTGAEVERMARWPELMASLLVQRRVAHLAREGAALWLAGERAPPFAALYPQASPRPLSAPPAAAAA